MRSIATMIAAAATLTMASPAFSQVVLEGNYIRVGISSFGTLGSNGSTDPGLVHDPSGTGTFDRNLDYIAPGTPHEGFSFNSVQSGFFGNDNDFGSSLTGANPVLLTGAGAEGYANAATWTGSNRFLSVTNSYFFNDNDERILVRTLVTALVNLSNLAFARSVDPDSDSRAFGTSSTNNQRGNSLFGVDDFVGSAGSVSGRTLALVNLNGDTLAHTTQINGDCCSNINPYDVLAHTGDDRGLSSSGDHGLNLAYLIGDLAAGSSVTLNYAYAVGNRIGDTGGTGEPGAVPEPATWATMLIGFGAIGGSLRRRSRRALRLA